MLKKGKIYLMPTPLDEYDSQWVLEGIIPILKDTSCFIVEELKTARRFLRSVIKDFDIDNSTFYVLNEHTNKEDTRLFLNPIYEGKNIILMSEAGCPGVADPGESIVLKAHEKGIEVKPIIGANSIILALMASGLNGQNFTFHGYLPIDRHELIRFLKKIELDSKTTKYTQAFIETPYRNEKMFLTLLETLNPKTLLCVAASITGKSEYIHTFTVEEWKTKKPNIHKKPAVFLINTHN